MEDSIIGLLFVFVPVILGLVAKKLEKAGKGGKVKPSMPEVFPAIDPDGVKKEVHVKEGVRSVPPAVPASKRKQASARKNSYATESQAESSKKEKIDPKKLVIYSEIMKPKF